MNDAIISIKPRHVENILQGRKTVELRVRNMSLPTGSTLWVYSTLPDGRIKISTEIDFIENLPPQEIWKKYGEKICISKKEFDKYTKSRDIVTAIGLKNIKPLEKYICLDTMRKYEKNFQPPQFFLRVSPNRALYSALYNHN